MQSEIRNPRILVINDNHLLIDKNGNQKFVNSTFHRFLTGFKKTDVTLSSPAFGKHRRKRLYIDGVSVIPRIPYGKANYFYLFFPYFLLRYFVHYIRIIRRFDGVFLVLPSCSALISYTVAILLGKPVCIYIVGDVYEVIDSINTYQGLFRPLSLFAAYWEKWFTRHLLKRAPAFVLGGNLLSEVKSHALRIIPAMTSLVRDDLIQPRPQELKETPSPFRLLSVCRLSPEKGLDIAIRVIAQLTVKDGLNLRYSIAGSGPELEKLRLLVYKLGISEKVEFLGHIDHQSLFKTIYPSADVFLLPSLSEGIPKTVLEAMACGLSVIASSVGGVSDLLGAESERGWLVKAGDQDELASALLECINNPKLRCSRQLAAHDYIKEHTLEKEAGRIEEELIRIIRHP